MKLSQVKCSLTGRSYHNALKKFVLDSATRLLDSAFGLPNVATRNLISMLQLLPWMAGQKMRDGIILKSGHRLVEPRARSQKQTAPRLEHRAAAWGSSAAEFGNSSRRVCDDEA